MKTNFKVLMALMGMEIGGAETHVMELCKALKRRGVDVYVISNGGTYVKELTDYGIMHFEAPLHNKNIYNMILSYHILKRVILQNDINLVHAHARIPAFLCGMLKKKLGFRFVTTCHGVYSTLLPFKMLTNWGEKSLAVSEDVRKYLLENYGLPEEDILMTINGIDTNKFSPDIDYYPLTREFGMDPARKRIVYVSRLDKGNCLMAYKLLECAEEIYGLNRKLEIFIVGAGTEYSAIRQKAVEINKKAQRKIVFMAGARTDMNMFLASADIVIAISRAALEAMSAEKPVILGGNPGYIGIFDEAKLDTAVKTNFCCRGCEAIDVNNLKADIIRLLRMEEPEIKKLGSFGRSVVKKYYSIKSMAESALALYEGVLKPKKKIDTVISGYYGFHNHGDDAVLKAIVDDLREIKEDIKITVLSKSPDETKKTLDVDAIHRLNFIKMMKLFKDTNVLISGGGSLIQDLTSTKSLIYYLFVISLAKRRLAKVMVYGNGIGPVRKDVNKERTRDVLNTVDLITLRDEESKQELDDIGVDIPPIEVTADSAFGLKITDKNAGEEKLKELGLENRKYFCVAIRSWKYLSESFEKEIIAFCSYVYLKHNLVPLFIPMQPNNDAEISKRIMSKAEYGGYYVGENYNLDEILGVISRSEFVLAMRLHTIIYAVKVGVPVIGLVYDPKVKALMERFKQNYYCDVEKINQESLKNYADFVTVNKEVISQNLRLMSHELEEKAFRNAYLAVELLNKDCF